MGSVFVLVFYFKLLRRESARVDTRTTYDGQGGAESGPRMAAICGRGARPLEAEAESSTGVMEFAKAADE